MAQWWELVIPAGAGVIGTLAGAVVQGRIARRLLAEQERGAAVARDEQFEHDRAERSAELRRGLYVSFISATDATFFAGDRLYGAAKVADGRDELFDTLTENYDRAAEVLNQMQLVASAEVLLAARALYEEMLPHTEDDYRDQRAHFLNAARSDLGVRGEVAVGEDAPRPWMRDPTRPA